MTVVLTKAIIKKIAPQARTDIVNTLVDSQSDFDRAGITTSLRMAHFLAQICTETGGLKSLEEDLNYSAARLCKVWPTRFKTIAAARPYANNPKKLANYVYGGRLGNNSTGDGWTFRGGGMIQTTGRTNYRAAGHENDPEALREPRPALLAALTYWTDRGCNAYADRDDVTGLRKRVQGGTTGLADAKTYLSRAKTALKSAPPVALASLNVDGSITGYTPTETSAEPAPDPAATPAADVPATTTPPVNAPADAATVVPNVITDPVLIEAAQTKLVELGYTEVGGVDGKIGPMTRAAILAFRNDNDLPLVDQIDQQFLDSLKSAPHRKLAPERMAASVSDVTNKVPEANAHWWTKIIAAVTGVPAAVGSVGIGSLDNISTAKGYVQPLQDVASDVPGYVWLGIVAAIAIGIFLIAQRGQNKSVEAFQTGERR